MDTQRLVDLWERATARGEDIYLATVVHVRGSSYRKPGARMLVTAGGERVGTISGGCLEGEVSRKIAWHTRNGASLQEYRSSFDDDDVASYGLGCDGTIWVLMERNDAVHATMHALRAALHARTRSVLILKLADGNPAGMQIVQEEHWTNELSAELSAHDKENCLRSLLENKTLDQYDTPNRSLPNRIFLPINPRPRLHVFGAGEDAQPLVRLGAELGWEVWVHDGRSHLLRSENFPNARSLNQLSYQKTGADRSELIDTLPITSEDRAVILTHSYDQDRALLKHLLKTQLPYLGILGPRHRTMRLLNEIAKELDMTPDECLARLHAPVGLNLGGHDASAIALSIIVEIQAHLAGRTLTVTSDQPASSYRNATSQSSLNALQQPATLKTLSLHSSPPAEQM